MRWNGIDNVSTKDITDIGKHASSVVCDRRAPNKQYKKTCCEHGL